MTKDNQLRLYNHFKSLLENPNPRGLKGVNVEFVKEQARRNIAQMTEGTNAKYADFVSNSKTSKTSEAK